MKRFNYIVYFLLLITFIFFPESLFSSDNQIINKFNDKINFQEPLEIFDRIVEGFEDGNISRVASSFSSQIYLSLNSGERGYYSSSQAYYILQNYFKIYRVISFKLTSRLVNSPTPYCAGKLYYSFKGTKNTAQVYIGLTLIENKWEITQITIN
ncbi:MAG: DUF4783 domain-containing protein [Ignavibacteria bacterium]|nr:DUF4783 domain-containing protein [Ignavibacteria bacterium]